MDISNKITYYMKVMSAYVANINSADDPSGDSKRAQVYIPSIQLEAEASYQSYIKSSDKKGSKEYRKFPWAFNTVENLKDGDLVYVVNINNTIGDYLIIGRDASCFPTGVGGGGGELDAAGIAELVIPIIIREECGFGSPPLYTDYWDSNIEKPCAVYTTATSSAWSVGLLNWDATRAYNLMFEIAKQDTNWERHFAGIDSDFVRNLKYDVSMGSSRGATHSIMITGRTSNQGIKKGIKAMASSPAGQEVQKKQARADVTSYVQGLMDEGITNPAILIYMADFCNQWGTGQPAKQPYLGKMHSAAKDPSQIVQLESGNIANAMNGYENPSQMMKEVEALHSYWMNTIHSEHGVNRYENRRNRVIAYIRELYKQGKLSQFSAGLTMIGDLHANTHNGITIALPFKDEIHTYQEKFGSAFSGQLTGPVTHPITALYGSYSGGSQHNGVDFSMPTGTELYAPCDGKMVIKYAGERKSYGYYATITFSKDGDNWTVICAHMKTNSSVQFGFQTNTEYDIKIGQIIGLSNNTGNSTGPHLHFEIRKNGKHLNPMPYLGFGTSHSTLHPGQISE